MYDLFITSVCPVCGENTLVSSTYTDVCHNRNCNYGERYPTFEERTRTNNNDNY